MTPGRRRPAQHRGAARGRRSRAPSAAGTLLRRSGAARGRSRLSRAAAGDRPYVAALFGLVALLAAMLVGPLHSFTSAAERVDSLEARRDDLQRRVDGLTERKERLRDPAEIEILAREKLGLVKPGEIPYVVAGDRDADDRVRPDGREPPPVVRLTWYERLGRLFARLLSR